MTSCKPRWERPRKPPRAALEVLVVVALHQPITRPEIEAVRGVSLSHATMELLLETGLIKAHGRRQVNRAGYADLVGHHAAVPGAVWSEEPARSAWVGCHIRALAFAAAWRAAFSR